MYIFVCFSHLAIRVWANDYLNHGSLNV